MIKAVGSSLTNIINGSIYGLMKQKWSVFEIRNFGDMLLYQALQQCIKERPSPCFPEKRPSKKIRIYERKKHFIGSNLELNGILDCFLNL